MKNAGRVQQLIIKKDERYAGTAFGKKTSMLYIDPLTATYFRDSIDNVSDQRKHTFGFLHLMTNCEEFFPKFSLRNKDYESTSLMIENYSTELIEPISEYFTTYPVYKMADMPTTFNPFECSVINQVTTQISGETLRPNADDSTLRTFRLAISTIG